MLYYYLTILNITLAFIGIACNAYVIFYYYVAARWAIGLVYIFSKLIGFIMIYSENLGGVQGEWQFRLVHTIMVSYTIYHAHCLKYSSIKKD